LSASAIATTVREHLSSATLICAAVLLLAVVSATRSTAQAQSPDRTLERHPSIAQYEPERKTAPPLARAKAASEQKIDLHAAPQLAPTDCIDFVNQNSDRLLCAWLTAPLDHFGDTAGEIQLPVLIAFASGNSGEFADRSILVPGGGGPGSPVGFGYEYGRDEFLSDYQPLLDAGFDVVIADQRGAGLSHPHLGCSAVISLFERSMLGELTFDELLAAQLDVTNQCKGNLIEKLAELDLPASGLDYFNTYQSAADFNLLLDILPHRHANLFATSYATAVAQAMLVLDPAAAERLILDSPVPLDFQEPLHTAVLVKAIGRTVRACNLQRGCKQRYNKLDQQLQQLIEQAQEKPFIVTIKVWDDDGIQRRKSIHVDHLVLINVLFTALYNNDFIDRVPGVIAQLFKGEVQALHDFTVDYWYQGVDPDYADGLANTVHCRERMQLENAFIANKFDFWQQIDQQSHDLMKMQQVLCNQWSGKQETIQTRDVRFTNPTLILLGELDPVISISDLATTSDNFHYSASLTAESTGHAVWYQNYCAQQQAMAFLQSPKPREFLRKRTFTCGANEKRHFK